MTCIKYSLYCKYYSTPQNRHRTGSGQAQKEQGTGTGART